MLNNKPLIINKFSIKDYNKTPSVNNDKPILHQSFHKISSIANKDFFNNNNLNKASLVIKHINNCNKNNFNDNHRKNNHCSADMASLPDIEGFNCTVSSCNDRLLINKMMLLEAKGFNYEHSIKINKRKNQSCLARKLNMIENKPNIIQFDKNVNRSNDVNLRNINEFTLREIHMMNNKKDMYLSHVEDKRNQLRRIIILNAGDRKYRENMRRVYCPYYV